MMQRFTDDAQKVLSLAQEAALELGHDYVGTEHVLIGLTKVKNSVAAKALEELGIVTENIFESRYKYTQELNRMGAKIKVEGRTAIIKGSRKIQGTNVVANDLRGGAALILEALSAKGKTQIDNIHYILRGYENIEQKLKKLGAEIYTED